MSRVSRITRLLACSVGLAILMTGVLAINAGATHNALGELYSTGPAGGNGDLPATFRGTSETGNHVWFETDESLVVGDTDTRQDVYQRLNGVLTLVSTGPSGGNGDFAASYAGSSADGSKVFIFTTEKLEAADTDNQTDVYQVFGAVTTRLSIGPNGGNGPRNAFFAGASPDGSHVFLQTSESLVATDTDNSTDVYDRTGATTIHVSAGAINGNGSFAATYQGSSSTGSRYFFETQERLASGDTDNEIDVYERSGSTTTWISFGPAGGNGDPLQSFHAFFAGASADGLKVYFETDEILTGDDADPTFDVYQRQGGVTTRISTGPNGGNDEWDASYRGSIADGTKVWFQTNEPLVLTDTDANFQDVYERSGGATTTLLSTGPTDTNTSDDASFAGATLSGNRVFMTTSAKLTSGDTDASARDIYERNGTTTTLMSTSATDPQGNFNAFFAGSSTDGSRVFFHTDDSLTSTDTDQSTIGPFPAQNEIQTVTVDATGGTFTLTFNSQTTAGIAFDATPAAVQAALEALSNFAPGDVAVTGSASNYTVEFQGAYAATNVNQLVGNGANLTGGAATVDVGSQTQGSPAIPAQLVGQQDVYERIGTTTTHLSVGPTGGNDPDLDATFVGASPDGTKVFMHTAESLATAFDTDSRQDVYGALVTSPFPRPGGGTPLRTPLMPAYKQCTSPNSQHVTPLANSSCAPPVLESNTLTTGTTGKMTGTARLDTVPGNTGTPADEADVRVNVSTTDVRNQADGTDYAGNLIFRLALRVSDRGTGTSEALSGTVGDTDISLPINCTTTPGDSTTGSSCSFNTTIDTLVPNFAREGKRSTIAVRSLKVLDAGVDGTITPPSGSCPPVCGSGDEKTFVESGLFTP